MIRTRTIREAAVYFRESDPDISLTETAIRTLLRTGAVPCARVGKKYLVSIEALEKYLIARRPLAISPRCGTTSTRSRTCGRTAFCPLRTRSIPTYFRISAAID